MFGFAQKRKYKEIEIVDPEAHVMIEIDPYKKVEHCGRICYQSYDKITDNSYVEFIDNLIKRGHVSVLEHVGLKLSLPEIIYCDFKTRYSADFNHFYYNDYTKTISGNVRAWREWVEEINPTHSCFKIAQVLFNHYSLFFEDLIDSSTFIDDDLLKDIKLDIDENFYTFKWITSRAVLAQLTRHRRLSYSVVSQRFVNYENKLIRFTAPKDLKLFKQNHYALDIWKKTCNASAVNYKTLTNLKATPQEAREVLTNSCTTEIIFSGHIYDIKKMLKLRTHKSACPPIRYLANKTKEIFNQYNRNR